MRITPLVDGTTELDIKLLPDGRTLIHWLKECTDGPIIIRGHSELRKIAGQQEVGHYIIVCNPKQNSIASQKRGNARFMCMTTGDPAATTCPNCLKGI